jgi:hypothetical protein
MDPLILIQLCIIPFSQLKKDTLFWVLHQYAQRCCTNATAPENLSRISPTSSEGGVFFLHRNKVVEIFRVFTPPRFWALRFTPFDSPFSQTRGVYDLISKDLSHVTFQDVFYLPFEIGILSPDCSSIHFR